MYRTTIMLPTDIKLRAQKLASRQGISLGEFIRIALIKQCNQQNNNERDLFFADHHFYEEDIPTDLSSQHDDYLY